MRGAFFAALLFALAASACRVEIGAPDGRCSGPSDSAPAGEVMIYTSMYRSVIDAIDPLIETKIPGVRVEWLESGSEKIQTRLESELAAGATEADLVLTSDPLWYARMKAGGQLLPYASVRALALPRAFVDPDGAYVASRLSTMVIAYNEKLVPKPEIPNSFRTLFTERFRRQITIPDPLASGTAFTTLSFLVDALNDELLERMRTLEVLASGGNSSAQARIESGEYRVGFMLLENVFAGRRKDAPVGYVIPEEGAVIIPGPLAILAKSDNPVAARAVYDAILSREVQAEIVRGDMHSPFEEISPPSGAPSLDELLRGHFTWSEDFIARARDGATALRARFRSAMEGSKP